MATKEYTLSVQDISCGHCVGRIEKALNINSISNVKVSIENKEVKFTSSNIDSPDVMKQAKDALEDAGFNL